jgi:hypothetical protein
MLASRRAAAWERCRHLAEEPDILAKVVGTLRGLGVVGQERLLKLLYLALTSRLLDRPVSLFVKGASSSGKSYATSRVLDLFPESAYYKLTSTSERALAYGNESLRHRMIILFEAGGISSELARDLLCTLLSEGRIFYDTVEKTSKGLTPRRIERAGPTGAIVNTTWPALATALETRMLSVPVDDGPAQIRRVVRAALTAPEVLAQERPDLWPWRALQEWLELGERRVTIPYAAALADMIPPLATRLNRDTGAVRRLIEAHALLHRATRERDGYGRIVATLDDYAAVHALVADLLAQEVGVAVPAGVRQAVQAVAELARDPAGVAGGVTVKLVAEKLGVDLSVASRRVRAALQRGYLVNLQDRPHQPAHLRIGSPMPGDGEVLPSPEALRARLAQDAARGGV